jgi:hypothetical protein
VKRIFYSQMNVWQISIATSRTPFPICWLRWVFKWFAGAWHSVIEYTKRYLSPSTAPYLRVWGQIFDSSQSQGWSMVLLLVELLFSIPISNAKVERLFSLMNRIKTDSRATLGESALIIRPHVSYPLVDGY